MENVAVFEDAARAFLRLLERVTPEQWAQPALGVWSVRDLAGHTSRAISTVEEYLTAAQPDSATCPDAEAYYLGIAGGTANDSAIAARGVAAGEALGDDPVATVSRSLDRTLAVIASQPSGRILSVYGGRTIALTEHLRTRILELVVHTMDLSRATGIPHTIPPRAIEDTASLAARIAVRRGDGDILLQTLTGRSTLPEGFSVV